MKNTIIYSVLFIAAFIGTTFGIYTFSNKYVDMFKLDFRDRSAFEKVIQDSLAKVSADSLAVSDSLHIGIPDSTKHIAQNESADVKIDSTKINEYEQKLSEKDKEIESLKNRMNEKSSGKYQDWLKKTIKLYEAMESNKAAEYIKSMPEDEARDIIYSMKQKKAAEILSNLEIETVQRLTKAQ
ncbi:MAG: hypothetical protein IPH62_04080 [Ignavibacteriae bacterium]|nr:hypothetical protein [Ignavibacteriota bacterium]